MSMFGLTLALTQSARGRQNQICDGGNEHGKERSEAGSEGQQESSEGQQQISRNQVDVGPQTQQQWVIGIRAVASI